MEAHGMITLAFISLNSITGILISAVGLGLVIFFHELGHFAVAKWCNVYVERFSIGFGPILLSWKWGETEYALSAIPFGGYVKMLGQDDADPTQMTSENLETDPRSYVAKNVPQRMAIISAGVIMNIITALLFFAIAFRSGVDVLPATVGQVVIGKSAWKAGMQTGDEITSINGRETETFLDIVRQTALSSTETLEITGIHPDGTTFRTTVIPEMKGTRREIGISPASSVQIPAIVAEGGTIVLQGTPAAKASPSFKPGDLIAAIDDQPIASYTDLVSVLSEKRADEVTYKVRRMDEKGKIVKQTTDIVVAPNPVRELGLWFDLGTIEAIQKDSPAAKAGMKVDDKIVKVDGLDIGKDLDALRLPEYFADRAGQNIQVIVSREEPGTGATEVEFSITPNSQVGWNQRPVMTNNPMSIPSLGVAYHLIPTVRHVIEGSPADGEIKPGERIEQLTLVLPEGKKDLETNAKLEFKFSETDRNLAFALWRMQSFEERSVTLTVKDEQGNTRTVSLDPADSTEWFHPARGTTLDLLEIPHKADNVGQAMAMGIQHTKNSAIDIYLTLRNLILQKLSVKELHGPIGIAKAAYSVSQRGIPEFMTFLGILSVNLAVLNFLPIPVLDGGHMVFLIWEGLTRKKPNEKVLIAATYVGMLFVLSLMVFVLFLDIFVHGFQGK